MACHCYNFNDMCIVCRNRYSLLVREAPAANPKRHAGEFYERPTATYPVVFTAQFRTENPREEGMGIPRQVLRRLCTWLKRPVHVYADIKTYVPQTQGEQPILWISILIDFPGKIRTDQNQTLKNFIFGNPALSHVCWNHDNPANPDDSDSDATDDLCLFRLEWFIRRLTRMPSGRF
ncbi:hypothetical protein BDV12DRAFT_193954 [Aspergillus spectabilis]